MNEDECLQSSGRHFNTFMVAEYFKLDYDRFSFQCLQVEDIHSAIADLKEKKIRLLSPEPRIGAHGKPVMFLHPKDCDGVLVEIEEV